MKIKFTGLLLLGLPIVAISSYGACNPEVLPACCTAETIYVCQELVPPSIECVEGDICGSSATFHIVGLNSGMERIQKIRHYFGDGDCPPDEILEDLPIPLQINIGWSVVADGTSYTGTGGLASVALPGDISSASCTFTLSANPSLCSQLDPIIYSVDAVAPTSQVAIASTEVDLPRINNLAPDLGWLLVVNTNLSKAVPVQLTVSMKPADGQVTLSMEERTAPVELWFRDNTGTNCILDTSILERTYPYDEWLAMVGDENSPRGEFLLLSAATGSCRLTLGCSVSTECEEVYETTNQLLTVVSPLLLPDYNRDGKIDTSDEELYLRGSIFRFWVNDDADRNSTNGDIARNSKILDHGNDDIPTLGADGTDNKVNGRRDLIDFTPIRVDVSKIVERVPESIHNKLKCRIRQDDESVNVVWSNLSPLNANSFQTINYPSGFGRGLGSAPQNAEVEQVTSIGIVMPTQFVARAEYGEGIIAIEGRKNTISPIAVEVLCDELLLCADKLDVSIKSVEDMYRWLGLRYVCGDHDLAGHTTAEPTNLPDDETVGPHYVFVHGYNVNAQSARGWAAEMFKRLWQAGARSKFTAVDWYGDESQLWAGVPLAGGESLNYYVNVRHALDTAQHLQTALSSLSGEKVLLAHSLGNMLVSEAATHYGLVYSKYYMLNAAVPMEAYDDSASNFEMIEHGWRDVPLDKWASHWHERIPYENDPRRTLKWKGRFAGIRNAVNCYSPTEDVLGNATTNWYGGLWSVQELYKGTATLHFVPGNCEGGWGYAGFLTDFAKTNDFTDAELVASPIFRKFDNELLHQTNRITIAQTELNKVLGDGIPALSFAAGANVIPAFGNAGNYNYQSVGNTPNGWPSERQEKCGESIVDTWLHSDLKNVAFYYVYKLFEKIKKGE